MQIMLRLNFVLFSVSFNSFASIVFTFPRETSEYTNYARKRRQFNSWWGS